MRVIIAGSRSVNPSIIEITDALTDAGWIDQITAVISGTAAGADRAGERWAASRNIQIIPMPANWTKHGRSAGPQRNAEMGRAGDALLLFWNGRSPGSKSMLSVMRALKKPCHVIMSEI